MKVGVLELLTTPARGAAEALYDFFITRTFPSITPQAISVWARQRGHTIHYATYYGLGDPKRLLPNDLDVVFLSCYTQLSPLAYALAKLFRREGTLTVIGGPHAKAFPADCLRFFDIVVGECDREVVEDILRGRCDRGIVVSSPQPFDAPPSVEERMPEIRASAFLWGRQRIFNTLVPMLTSLGCPYTCDFCVDWNNPYRLLPLERLTQDLDFVSRYLPGSLIGFHDPNFAVKFDRVLEALEHLPPERRNPYVMESSLAILRGSRLRRLEDTRCVLVAPGVESWSDYSPKAGAARLTGHEKVDRVVEQFVALNEHVPYLQANFMFGLDSDRGEEPVELLKDFVWRAPFVWPVVNIPHPFGSTPLFDRYLAAGRVLESMPFAFYYSPYVVTVLENYDPFAYYEKLIEIFEHITSSVMLRRRLRATSHAMVRAAHLTRTLVKRRRKRAFQRLLSELRSNRCFRAFHEGRERELPEFYSAEFARLFGRYAGLLSSAERRPVFERSRAPRPAV